MKAFRKIFIILLILMGLVILAAFLLGRFYRDEIARYAIGEINDRIRTKVYVEEMKLSFLKRFPDATLVFDHVLVHHVPDYHAGGFESHNDTLLYARQIYLRFNVIQLMKRRYLLREVSIRSARLWLLTDPAGNTNYEFWKEGTEPGQERFLLQLDHVTGQDIRIDYINRALGLETRGLIGKVSLRGKFAESSYRMNLSIEGRILGHRKEGILFFRDQPVALSSSLQVSPELVEIYSGDLKMAGQKLSLSGEIIRKESDFYRLSLKGERLDLENLLKYLATHFEELPGGIDAGGILTFDAEVNGEAGKTRMPGITARFTLDNGRVRTEKLKKEIRRIHTLGMYTNGKARGPASSRIQLSKTSFWYGNSRLGGDFSFHDFTSPEVDHNIKLELDLQDLEEFRKKNPRIISLEGKLVAGIQISGSQSNALKITRQELLNHQLKASFRLQEAGFRLAGSAFACGSINGDFSYGDYLGINNLNAVLGNHHVSFTGRGDNLREFLFTERGNLWLDLDVYSDTADMNAIFRMFEKNSDVRRSDTSRLAERIYVKSRFWFDDFTLKTFTARDVRGDLIYQPGKLTLKKFNMTTLKGSLNGEGLIAKQGDHSYLLKIITHADRIDIHDGFAAFNNFGQDFIQDKHLKGDLSGSVHFSSVFNNERKINKESILAECDIIVRNGELVEFGPMQKLSRFIDVEELENITFSTLSNQIYIRNQEVLIPAMEINSSAFDINGSGIHGFDRNFEYKVKVSLSELLSGKVRKPDRQTEEFGAIEDDGLGRVYLYLIIEGSPGDTRISYDRRGAMEHVRQQMREEKTQVRRILNEEFGLFKKDSTLDQDTEEAPPPGFIIEWEEDMNTGNLQRDVREEGNNSESGGFIIRWEEEEKPDTLEDTEPKEKKRRLFNKRKGE